jgi:tetratricopeptide (TPR) repeat protein
MKCDKNHFITAALAMVLSWSTSAIAYDVDPATYVKLPYSCQSWFVAMGRRGSVHGMSFSGINPPLDLNSAIGANTNRMNHYCPSLVALIRFKESDPEQLDEAERTRQLAAILKGIDQQVPHSGGWFKAEVLRNKCHVHRLLSESKQAEKACRSAFRTYPPYLPAYWELASIYEAGSDYEKAISTLQDAMEHAKSPSYQQTIADRIERLRELAAHQSADS